MAACQDPEQGRTKDRCRARSYVWSDASSEGGTRSSSDSAWARTWAAADSSATEDVEVMALATRNSMDRLPGTAKRQICEGVQ